MRGDHSLQKAGGAFRPLVTEYSALSPSGILSQLLITTIEEPKGSSTLALLIAMLLAAFRTHDWTRARVEPRVCVRECSRARRNRMLKLPAKCQLRLRVGEQSSPGSSDRKH